MCRTPKVYKKTIHVHACVCLPAWAYLCLYVHISIQTIAWSQELHEFPILDIILILARCAEAYCSLVRFFTLVVLIPRLVIKNMRNKPSPGGGLVGEASAYLIGRNQT